jgi:hypothetical protein
MYVRRARSALIAAVVASGECLYLNIGSEDMGNMGSLGRLCNVYLPSIWDASDICVGVTNEIDTTKVKKSTSDSSRVHVDVRAKPILVPGKISVF